ncbi:hypothetical protein [Petropleomorpha daqingensis]|uniref:Catalytic LigB subunit of aromatic ring-opening dioxygenase n=1 Tax=Petropleomorpha daqingensis TaxID=2026353 RepID=A0A853CAI5_9ACTN|nr:hypothetical protein [Petropleomorpha daqingensis]
MTAVPPAPRAAVAFCPSPPVLVPAVAGTADGGLPDLRGACAAAVDALLTGAPEVVVVVGPGVEDGVRFGPGDAGDLRSFGVDLEVPFSAGIRPGGRRLPWAHTLGAWLLDEAGHAGARLGVGPADLAAALSDLPGTVGVLALGDGSARRTERAPAAFDEAAGPFDTAVAAALAAGDAAALAGLDPAEGERLLATGAPVWQAVGAALAGRAARATLHYDAAPFGVGYLVADWQVQ